MKKKVWSFVMLLFLTVILLGCGQVSYRSNDEKELIFGDTTFNAENGEPDINPHNSSSGWACIRYGVGETLFRFNDHMEVEPWLAKSYKMLDEYTWEITLRDGISFTSGRAMDGQAVKECLDKLVKDHARAAGNLHIKQISADKMKLIIKTEIPVPTLINYLADPYGCIYDVKAGVTEDGIVQGTGPYRAVSLTTDKELDLVKNENYWNGEPKIDRIKVLTITDGNTLAMALQTGEIDAAYGMPYASYPLFENDAYHFSACATSRVFFGAMNFKSSIIQDSAVRKAISMGIDKQSFVRTLLDGNGYPASGVYPDLYSFGGEMSEAESYNPEAAKQLLDQAGWKDTDGDGIREKNGNKLVIRWLTYPSRQELPVLAEAAQATLKDIGIQVDIINTASHNSIRKDTGAWDVYFSSFVTAPTGDPEYFFTYHCLDSSSSNDGSYHSDRLEKLAQKLSGTFDADERDQLAVEMQQTILKDNGYIFCSHLRMCIISRSEVTGLTAHPCDYYEITAQLDIN